MDDDPTDVVRLVSDSRVKLDRGFYRSMSMKFCRKGNLEKDVSHDVRAERLSERDWLSSVNDVLKTPLFCRLRSGIAHFTANCLERVKNTARSRITGRPALSRPCVRSMAIGA